MEMARSKLVRISKHDVRFLSQNFVVHGQHELLHGIELVARYFQTNPSEVESAFELKDRRMEQNFYTVDNVLTVFQDLYPNEFRILEEDFSRCLLLTPLSGHLTGMG